MASNSLPPIRDRYLHFAKAYSDPYHSTLSAFSAIARAQDFAHELNRFQEEEVDLHLNYAEITSYYLVAAVTCLEWHARARFRDLLLYRPETLSDDNLKELRITAKHLTQCISLGVPIAHLCASAMHVNNTSEYIGVFNKIFSALSTDLESFDIIRNIVIVPLYEGAAENKNALDEIFQLRHVLVHELNETIVGHRTFRTLFALSDASGFIRIVSEAMVALEQKLTETMPDDFPGLLDENQISISQETRLKEAIKRLEDEISELYNASDLSEEHAIDRASWVASLAYSRSSVDAEFEFIDNAAALHSRYVDYRSPLRLLILEGRLKYLLRLRNEVDELSPTPKREPRLSFVGR